MPDPKIEVLGVYPIPVTEELFREQFDILYSYDMSDEARARAKQQVREQLETCVLLEVSVKDVDSLYDAGDFSQHDQVAYDEHYLSDDGEGLLPEHWNPPPKTNCYRVAFFLHYFNSRLPLHTSYGDVMCPSPTEMPERLKRLVPYEPVD